MLKKILIDGSQRLSEGRLELLESFPPYIRAVAETSKGNKDIFIFGSFSRGCVITWPFSRSIKIH
ncbi:hypothetical protein OUZ56_002782 [Daphnia magna]|uniref:Uncharacterized protein n=1 Tax=Daphnia magna TaxID=35525 RepID=A0ABR0A6Q6_9CRUS|nr:hypothetical protein OUZ56_002782 [Daphnia magna]